MSGVPASCAAPCEAFCFPGLGGNPSSRSTKTKDIYFKSIRNAKRSMWVSAQASASVPGPLFMAGEPGDNDFLKRLANAGSFVKFPVRDTSSLKRTPPLVRVRLSVDYRVHSRQMLCVGGSAIPFGWSFLSIAKVPMCWQPRDTWTVEVELPAGSKVEYKYVILEEQDWTQQVNANSEGMVDYTYRVQPETQPPDVQKITRKMAIVAWQSGSNRVLVVPSEKEIRQIQPGEKVQRVFECDVGGSTSPWTSSNDTCEPDHCKEILYFDEENRPVLERRDVWGYGKSPYR